MGENEQSNPPLPQSRGRVVIDTSVFVNPDSMQRFGESSGGAVREFLSMCRRLSLEVYVPLSVFRELSTFLPEETTTLLRSRAIVREPDLYTTQVPAATFHTFVRELRDRVNKGLQIAEKAIRSADSPENIRWVRQHYREALRTGIVDSVEDLEVVLFAREVGGFVLTADDGIANMAGSFGIEVFNGREFLDYCRDSEKR